MTSKWTTGCPMFAPLRAAPRRRLVACAAHETTGDRGSHLPDSSSLRPLPATAGVLQPRLRVAQLGPAVGQRGLDLLQRPARRRHGLLGLRLGLLGAPQLLAPSRLLPLGGRPRPLLLRAPAL